MPNTIYALCGRSERSSRRLLGEGGQPALAHERRADLPFHRARPSACYQARFFAGTQAGTRSVSGRLRGIGSQQSRRDSAHH